METVDTNPDLSQKKLYAEDVFSFRTLVIVLVIFWLIFLLFKHVIPTIRQGLKKQ